MLNKIISNSIIAILVATILLILTFNYSLYYQPKFVHKNNTVYNQDVYRQLQFLKQTLKNGAANEMQMIFPEGFVFINCLYGLSWCNFAEDFNKNSNLYKEAVSEINWSLEQVNSDNAKSIFQKKLPVEYGVFYKGWTNYLLAKKLQLQPNNHRKVEEVNKFKKNCDQLFTNYHNSKVPYLESYKNQTWPADNVLAIASLKIHNEIFGKSNYAIEDWIEKVKRHLDKSTNLIPHSVDPITNETWQAAKGNSQSLMLYFLYDINEDFALEQFNIYKKSFLTQSAFLPGIREHPKGIKGKGDVDSGPVIFGIGGAASIVGQLSYGKYKDWKIYEGLRNCIETFGVGLTIGKKKRYIFGQLAMADAFICWSNSIENKPDMISYSGNWRWKFQLCSLFTILLILNFLKKNLID